jgi:hypothetical protein
MYILILRIRFRLIRRQRMTLSRRRFCFLTAGAATLPLLGNIAWAQSYPSRPVHIIVGFPAGGTSDIVARDRPVALGTSGSALFDQLVASGAHLGLMAVVFDADCR